MYWPTIIHKTSEAHYGKGFIAISQDFFASINTIFILAGRMGARLSFLEV